MSNEFKDINGYFLGDKVEIIDCKHPSMIGKQWFIAEIDHTSDNEGLPYKLVPDFEYFSLGYYVNHTQITKI